MIESSAASPRPFVPLPRRIHIHPGGWFALDPRALWEYRELLYFLVWRDVKVRYKQTALGMLWVLLQPAASVLIFSLLFGALLKVPSGGLPYPVFACAGLLPWSYFAAALTRCSTSLVGSANLITKVYFPRIAIPISSVLSALVDFAVGLIVLAALMAYYGVWPGRSLLALPLLVALAATNAFAFGTWLAALNVRYRDIAHLVPFLIQTWMFVTPVIYDSSLIPARFRAFTALNPLTPVVEGFRWVFTGQSPPLLDDGLGGLALSGMIVLGTLFTGLLVFRRTERTFADVV